MTVEIVQLTHEDALYVVKNMREDDRREVFATRWNDCDYDLAHSCANQPGVKWVALLDGEPVAIGGVSIHQPGIGQAWLMGTDKLPQAGLTLTRYCKDVVDKLMNDESGLHRVQAHSAAFHTLAHDWLMAVGLDQRVELPRYGKAGEDFILFYAVRKGG